MTWFYNAAAAVGSFIANNYMTIAAVTSAAVTAYGTYQDGQAQKAQQENLGAQLDARAKQERALAQFERARRKRIGKAQLSTQRSLLADSGFASDDPSSLHLISETVGAQTLEELLVLAQGEDEGRQSEFASSQASFAGKQAERNANIGVLSEAMQSGVSWYDRYGGSRRPSSGTPSKKRTGGYSRPSSAPTQKWG